MRRTRDAPSGRLPMYPRRRCDSDRCRWGGGVPVRGGCRRLLRRRDIRRKQSADPLNLLEGCLDSGRQTSVDAR